MDQQEGRRQYNIRDLCLALQVSCDQLPLRCNFCGKVLSVLDKVQFDYTDLVLLWKRGLPVGACHFCIKKLATYEFVRFFESSYSAFAISLLLGIPFTHTAIRCQFCLRSLSCCEKAEIQERDWPVYRVRGRWRSACYWCRVRLR